MSAIDIARALQGLEGNEELLKDLASMFVEDAPIILDQLKVALMDNNAAQVKATVHSLRGLISTFYATTSVEIALRLEDCAADGNLGEFSNRDLEQLEKCINSVVDDFQQRGWVGRL